MRANPSGIPPDLLECSRAGGDLEPDPGDHMTGLSIWLWLAIAVIATMVLNPWIAYRKNRSPGLWFVLGLLFNPVALVVLLFRPTLPRPPYRRPAAPGALRTIE
jgi:hypothetical protein